MILYKNSITNGKIERPSRTVKVAIDENFTRPVPAYNKPREKTKHIKACETAIRSSMEYKNLVKFLKKTVDMGRCAIMKNVKLGDGKRYRIELHHEPFTLFDIVQVVIDKRLALGESIEKLSVADEVMELHYAGVIGLIPLSFTMHELVHNGRVFIPTQMTYMDYTKFYEDYEPYIDENPQLKDRINAKAELSMKTSTFVSDVLDVEFTYLDIDGYEFPEIPDDWKDALKLVDKVVDDATK